jgi:uncharacterized protein YggE
MAKAEAKAQPPVDRTVTVAASGSVAAEPDMADIATGVVTEADTAAAAVQANSAAMKAVIAGMKGLGIPANDIRTVAFNVEPRYESRAPTGNAPKITGYRVVNQVRITARNIARLGDVLDRLVGLGANQMHGLSFAVSRAETLRDEARKLAMANAFRRAQLYAAAAGAEVGEVLAISEDAPHAMPRGAMAARSSMLESVPIESGGQALEASVTVTWALK